MPNINVGRGPEYYFVGADNVMGSVFNDATETEILDYVIPADTVQNGIIIEALVRFRNDTGLLANSIFRIKAGTDGAEVEITQLNLYIAAVETNVDKYMWIKTVVDDLDWTAEQSVSITGKNNAANVGIASYGYTLIIMGF